MMTVGDLIAFLSKKATTDIIEISPATYTITVRTPVEDVKPAEPVTLEGENSNA